MAWETRRTFGLVCVFLLIAFGEARLRDRRTRKGALGDNVEDSSDVKPPTNLKVHTLSNTSIQASWSYGFPRPEAFQLRCCTSDPGSCFPSIMSGNFLTVNFTNLKPGTEYQISISAQNGGDVSVPAVANATTFPNVDHTRSTDVKPPTNLKVHALSNTSIQASWSYGFPRPDAFQMRCCTSDPGPCFPSFMSGNFLRTNFTNLKPGTEYQISISAQNGGDVSVPAVANATTFPNVDDARSTDVKPPTNLKVHALSNTSIKASWSYEFQPPDEFSIECCNSNQMSCVSSVISGIFLATNFTKLKPGTEYQISVSAIDGWDASVPAVGKATTFPNAPKVTGLELVVLGNSSIGVRWNKPEVQVTRYQIGACPVVAGGPCVEARTTDESHILQNLRPSTEYEVSVVSVIQTRRFTSFSVPATARATTEVYVPPVKNLALHCPSVGVIVAEWTLTETWLVDTIRISACPPSRDDCRSIEVSAGGTTSVRFQNLVADVEYTVNATTLWTFGGETYSGEPAISKIFTPPNVPSVEDLNLQCPYSGSIVAEWTLEDSSIVDTIRITACPPEREGCRHEDVHSDTTSVQFEDLRGSVDYTVNVTTLRTVNGTTYSGNPTIKKITTPPHVPSVESLELRCPTSGVIVAEWKIIEPSAVDAILVTTCSVPGNDCRKVNLKSNVTSVHFTNLLPNENYTVNVTTFRTLERTTYSGRPAIDHIVTPPNPPGKVGNLTHEISNVTRVKASWVEPSNPDGTQVDGYVLSCKEVDGNETARTKEVPPTGRKLSTLLNLEEPLSKFECSVWAYVYYGETRINGTSTGFEVKTESPAPGKVLNLKFGVLNVTTLNVSWDRPSEAPWGVSGYVVDCKNADTNKSEAHYKFMDDKKHVNQHVDLHEQLTKFSCIVYAYVQNGPDYFNGSAAGFEVETHGIAAPKNVKLVERTATSFTFEWDSDPKAPNYTIHTEVLDQVDVSDSLTETVYGESNGTVTANVSNLVPATMYKVYIRNCAAYCGKVTELEQETRVAAPSAARHLKATVEGYTNVTLSWTRPEKPNGPIDGYTVEIFDTERNETFRKDLNTTSVTLNVVYKFTDFSAAVAPYNLDDNTTLHGPTTEVDFSSSGDGPVPPRPHVDDVEDHSVRLTWEVPKDANHTIVGYEVTLSPGDKNITTNSTNVNLTDLQAWTEYSVYVSSCTSATVCGTPKTAMFWTDVDAPSAPQNLTVHSSGTHWVEVEWKPPQYPNGPLNGYNVTLTNGTEHIWATTRNTSHNVTGLEPGTSYEISVYAYNTAKQGEKKGPTASFTAQTSSDASGGGGVSGATIAAAVLLPLLILLLVVGYFLYRKYGKKGEDSQSLLSSAGS